MSCPCLLSGGMCCANVIGTYTTIPPQPMYGPCDGMKSTAPCERLIDDLVKRVQQQTIELTKQTFRHMNAGQLEDLARDYYVK